MLMSRTILQRKTEQASVLTKYPVLLLVLFCLAGAVPVAGEVHGPQPPAIAAEAPRVAIEQLTHEDQTPYAVIYRAGRGDCSVSWIAYQNEPGVVKYDAVCPAPLAEQLPLLNAIGVTYLSQDRNAPAFHVLFWGRLAPDDVRASREMSLRLALAAFRSADWDKARGKPKAGDINLFARDLANQAGIYPELTELFKTLHRSVALTHVEKVLVVKAKKLPLFPELKQLGVKGSDRLPFDFMAWFSILPE
jgi:hypothetical protein